MAWTATHNFDWVGGAGGGTCLVFKEASPLFGETGQENFMKF